MKTKKDFLGQEMSIGDEVLYIVKYGNYTEFNEGTVVSFGEDYTEILGKGNIKTGKVLSHRVIKKPTIENSSYQDISILNLPCADRCSVLQLEDLDDSENLLVSFNFYRYFHEYENLTFRKRLRNAWGYLVKKKGLLTFEFIADRETLNMTYLYLKNKLNKPVKNK